MATKTLFIKGCEKNILLAELMCVTYSAYSGNPSILLTNSISAVYECRSEDFLEEEEKTYNPLLDRFLLSRLEINDNIYLERNGDTGFSFPSSHSTDLDNTSILHGPDIINGYENTDLYLGLIASTQDTASVIYEWFRNGYKIIKCPKMCILKVNEPGEYHCVVTKGTKREASSRVTVEAVSGDDKEVCPYERKTEKPFYPKSVSAASMLRPIT